MNAAAAADPVGGPLEGGVRLDHVRDTVVAALPWVIPALLVLLALAVAAAAVAAGGRYRHSDGLAGSSQINGVASRGALTSGAKQTRPGWDRKLARKSGTPLRFGDVGTRIGKAGWGRLWWFGASHEAGIGVLAPQQQGKTRRLLARFVADAPGTVIAASTKPDLLTLTRPLLGGRQVTVFDPDGLLDTSTRTQVRSVRWSPVYGCEVSAVAIRRADAFVGDGADSDATNARFFAGSAAQVLQCLLHAAALSGHTIGDVVRWAADPRDRTPINVLAEDPRAAPGWSAILAGHTAGTEGTGSKGDVFKQLNLSLNLFADPAVLAQASPALRAGGDAGGQFDVDAFLRSGDALYVLSSNRAVNSSAYTTMFVTELLSRAQDLALTFPHQRWEPPVTFVLDELTNTARVPSLPAFIADSGGRGIALRWASQSRAQLVQVWGPHGASALLTNSTWKVILQGLDDAEFLGDLERLAGVTDEKMPGSSFNDSGAVRTRQVPVLPVASIRTQRKMTATIWAAALPPFRGKLVDISQDLKEAADVERREAKRSARRAARPQAAVPVVPTNERHTADRSGAVR